MTRRKEKLSCLDPAKSKIIKKERVVVIAVTAGVSASPSSSAEMNDLITDSFVAAAAKAKPAKASASLAGGDDAQFLAEAEGAKEEISSLRQQISTLQKSPSLSAHHPQVNSLVVAARGLLSRLASMERRSANSTAASNVAAGLRSRLRDITADIYSLQRRLSLEHRSAVKQYYTNIVGEEPTEETLNKLVAGGRGEAEVRRIVLTAATGRGDVNAAIQELDRENQTTRGIETDLRELEQMFRQMEEMVHDQGSDLGNIERKVYAASGDARRGVEDLERAREYQQSSRRQCLCIGAAAAAVVILAIAAAVVAVLLSRKSVMGPGPLVSAS